MWFPPKENEENVQQNDNAAVRKPILPQEEISRFKALLHAGQVKFSYYKTVKDKKKKTVKDENGNTVFDIEHPRTALGTMAQALLPVPKEKQELKDLDKKIDQAAEKIIKKHQAPTDSIVYFDLEANGFRSLKQDGLIEFAAVQ